MNVVTPPWLRNAIDSGTEIRSVVAKQAPAPPPKKHRINIRQKGANGERELATELNGIVNTLLIKHGIQVPEKPVIQRNQNQSAVGGADLSNCFGISIEVKRQEQLSVNKWWQQCTASAAKNLDFPVLIYRQNKQAWRVVMYVWSQLPPSEGNPVAMMVRGELNWSDFLQWFHNWVDRKLSNGELPQC